MLVGSNLVEKEGLHHKPERFGERFHFTFSLNFVFEAGKGEDNVINHFKIGFNLFGNVCAVFDEEQFQDFRLELRKVI